MSGCRARTPTLLGLFFAFATIMCLLAGTSLLTPGGPLDPIWRVKAEEHRSLLAIGPGVGIGFLLLALVMLAASVGSFRRTRWGRQLAIAILAVNAMGDAARIASGAVAEGLIGVAAAGAILWWLTRRPVRAAFDRWPAGFRPWPCGDLRKAARRRRW